MTLLDRLFSGMFSPKPESISTALRGIPLEGAFTPQLKASADLMVVQPNSIGGWSGVDYQRWQNEVVQDSQVKVATIYSCLRLVANSVSEAPMRVYQRVEGRPEVQSTHRAQLVLDRPNPEQSWIEWQQSVVYIAGSCNYALLELIRNGVGEVIQMYPRTPGRWTRREIGGTYYWEHTSSKTGRIRRVRDEDMRVVPYDIHPTLEAYGVSPVTVIAREAGIDYMLTAFLARYLDRGGIIPYVLTQDGPLWDSAQVRKAQVEMQSYHAGGAIERPPVLTGGLKMQSTGSSLNDMAWPDLRGINELKIAQAFGILPQLVGAKESVEHTGLSPSDLNQAQAYHQRYVAQPFRVRLAGILTRTLLDPDSDLYIAPDLTEVLALREERNALHDRARADALAGLSTVDESRQEVGRPEVPNGAGQVFLRQFNYLEVPAGEAAADQPVPGNTSSTVPPKRERPEGRYKAFASLEAKAVEERWVATQRRRQEQLAKLGNQKLVRFFRDQGKRLIPQILKGYTDPNVLTLSERSLKTLEDVDWDDELERLQYVLEPLMLQSAEVAISDVNKLFGSDVAWDVSNPFVRQIWDQLGLRIVGINDTTRLQVAKTVAEGLDQGLSLSQLEARLYGLFEETYKGRSMTIARTETQVALNTASVYGFSESGEVDEVRLWDNPDHPEEYGASDGMTCATRNGHVAYLRDSYKHIRAEHPNGSLAVSPIVREPLV
jgi:HK97 family phage portal protein